MVAMYTIAGRQVGSHVLAMATLGSVGAIAFLSMGGKKAAETQGPPLNAKSKEEESFIKDFVKKPKGEKET